MSRQIRFRLNPESIDEAISEIKSYRDEIVKITRQLGETLISDGVDICRMKIQMYDAIETGALLGSVEGFFDAELGKGFVRVGTDHAAYVEYGTGIVGARAQDLSPDRPSSWDYDVNHHGDEGWYYDHGRWTKGMQPRPFMYETFIELCNRLHELRKNYD